MSDNVGLSMCKVLDYKTHFRLCYVLRPAIMSDETIEKIKETKLKNKLSGNKTKLKNSISRSKNIIYQYACCNEWEYFITLTINKNKYDRYNLDEYKTSFTKWLHNKYARYGTKIKFLFIPEKHKDASWHMHGLISGIPQDSLEEFTSDMHIPYKLLNRINKGVKVYNWSAYSDKFGYCSLEPIQNVEAVCKYITKYICKDLADSVQEVGKHLYYVSRGLKKADVVSAGSLNTYNNILWDYENDYVCIKSFSKEFYSKDDVLKLLVNNDSDTDSIYNYSQNTSFTKCCRSIEFFMNIITIYR